MTPLPVDLMLEIARRTDPATLARYAAACKDLRRHIIDPSFRGGRLRLRHGERFAPPSSLRLGQLVCMRGEDMYLEDHTTKAAASNLVATGLFNGAETELCTPMAARDGLVLVRVSKQHATTAEETFRVCCPATRRWQSLPPAPAPAFPGHLVLLVGGGAAGRRPFKVVKVGWEMSQTDHPRRCRHSLLIQTLSSERGAWGPRTSIRVPFETSTSRSSMSTNPGRHLVVGDAIHWLCHNDDTYYVLKLDVGGASDGEAGLTVTELPTSFRRKCRLSRVDSESQVLLATAWAAGSLVVLVANHGRISAWTMMSGRWAKKPRVVVKYEAMERLLMDGVQDSRPTVKKVRLEWFAESSGVVLLSTSHRDFFWLDLQSGKIVRHYSSVLFGVRTCPYEMDLSS